MTENELLEKILDLREKIVTYRRENMALRRALDQLTIREIGARGELTATKRELAGVRAAASAAVNGAGPLSCADCDAPLIAKLRAALARKIW